MTTTAANQSKSAPIAIVLAGLILLFISQLLLSFGYDFLMSQAPIDFAHWSMLLASLALFGLWYVLPLNPTRNLGLFIMTIGIGGMVGMSSIDFILWAAHDTPQLKDQIFHLISQHDSIRIPFLILGPTLFYMGLGIATYGLIKKYTWQVITLNLGLLMIGLGHMILHNQLIPVIGAAILLVALSTILIHHKQNH